MTRGRAEGPLRSEQPSSATDLKLILGGKFLENGDVLEGVVKGSEQRASCSLKGSILMTSVIVGEWRRCVGVPLWRGQRCDLACGCATSDSGEVSWCAHCISRRLTLNVF